MAADDGLEHADNLVLGKNPLKKGGPPNMNCPECKYEPRDRLLHTPCPKCGHEWWDTESYVRMLAKDLKINRVLDIGCGLKGTIAQHYWDNDRKVLGYACDVHVIKELPANWTPMLMDAAELTNTGLQVEFTTCCGMLEHVDYQHAFRVLHAIEQVTSQMIFLTCSAVLRQVDYKVKMDGNPFHYYLSYWAAPPLEALGYTVDRERMKRRATFTEELMAWQDRTKPLAPWEERKAQAIKILKSRRCHVPGCKEITVGWDVDSATHFCFKHIIKEQWRAYFKHGSYLQNPHETNYPGVNL